MLCATNVKTNISNQLEYKWDSSLAVDLIPGLALSQFDLINYPYRNSTYFFNNGITTVLTLSTFGLDTRTDLPKVPYPTSLDWFVIMCFSFVIFTLLEFAGVHYFTKVGSGELPLTDEGSEVAQQVTKAVDSDREEEEEQNGDFLVPLQSIEECSCGMRKVSMQSAPRSQKMGKGELRSHQCTPDVSS
ncbi:hypothetical protein HPB48_024965 [Haemaphysalis longicornis]|uniref:Neurotransmitter-gated ion-channel transmembrane domain-containing protein n=1 Tax=Haemaphysalis longicornis TaxID=44386 RepID=A0A9J6H947_HAELO|nr:hypothetical protein HPB48_024965 [Haemaphysalis longicornis]